jgi:hypothetical protein
VPLTASVSAPRRPVGSGNRHEAAEVQPRLDWQSEPDWSLGNPGPCQPIRVPLPALLPKVIRYTVGYKFLCSSAKNLRDDDRTFVVSLRDTPVMRGALFLTTYCLTVVVATVAWSWMLVDLAEWLIGR